MMAWIWCAVLFDGAAAILFLALGIKRRHKILIGSAIGLLVAMGLLLSAILGKVTDLVSMGFLLGFAACVVGFLAITGR